jgi:hypothetical protein
MHPCHAPVSAPQHTTPPTRDCLKSAFQPLGRDVHLRSGALPTLSFRAAARNRRAKRPFMNERSAR